MPTGTYTLPARPSYRDSLPFRASVDLRQRQSIVGLHAWLDAYSIAAAAKSLRSKNKRGRGPAQGERRVQCGKGQGVFNVVVRHVAARDECDCKC